MMAPPAVNLTPDAHGLVYVATSAIFRALISTEFIGCEADFTSAPLVEGYQPTGVRVESDGNLTWILGNLGHLPVVKLAAGGHYTALGWAISVADDGGIEATNTTTGKAFAIHPDRAEAL